MPRGITAIGTFLFFGATMALFAGTTLTWPGTSLNRMLALNPTAHKQLATFAKPAGVFFLLLARCWCWGAVAGSNADVGGGDWPWRLSRPSSR